ncbi:MAG: ABC-type transport auxiliary lipoprotein family protein [Pseudomonadota bacterium]
MPRRILFMVCFVLAACTGTPDRFAVAPPVPEARQAIVFGAVEISDVTLPAYAAADEIPRLDADGRVISDGSVLWADTPDRAIELELARLLGEITGARVASAPWPFEAFPNARLEVRFETLLARPDGRFQARGQYFVAVTDALERSGRFDLSVPYDTEAGPQAIAMARGQAVADLALFIARNGLR